MVTSRTFLTRFEFELDFKNQKQPENVLVDYEIRNGVVKNFNCTLSDWGTAYISGTNEFMGGTPGYAGPKSFETRNKDVFSFGRLAAELFMEKEGLGQIDFAYRSVNENDQIKDWLYYCFFPQEDFRQLNAYRSHLCPFLQLIMRALNFELRVGFIADNDGELLCDDIIQEARNLVSTSTPISPQISTLNTLLIEHNQLQLNIQ